MGRRVRHESRTDQTQRRGIRGDDRKDQIESIRSNAWRETCHAFFIFRKPADGFQYYFHACLIYFERPVNSTVRKGGRWREASGD